MDIIADRLTAGMAWDWEVILTAYAPPQHGMLIVLRGPSALDLPGVPNAAGTGFRFVASSAQTAALAPGAYAWQAILSEGFREWVLDSGRIAIAADLRTLGAGHDPRSFAERALANVEAVLENRATIEQRRYQINNRSLDRTSVGELMKLRTQLAAQVAAEAARRAGSSPLGRRFLTRF